MSTPTEKLRQNTSIMTRRELEVARLSGAKIRQLNHGTFSVNNYVYQIEELESKAEEAREQEAQAKARLAQAVTEQRQVRINYLKQAIGTYRRMLIDEHSAVSFYTTLIEQNSRYITITTLIGKLLAAEKEHVVILESTIRQLETEQRMITGGVPVKEWRR